MAETAAVAPPIGDITVHEHDVRGAIGRSGARDSAAVWHTSDLLLAALRTPVPLRVIVEDAKYRSGPDDGPKYGCALRDSKPFGGERAAAAAPS